MSLSKEVLENIANTKKMGLGKVADARPEKTREQMKKAPANLNPPSWALDSVQWQCLGVTYSRLY